MTSPLCRENGPDDRAPMLAIRLLNSPHGRGYAPLGWRPTDTAPERVSVAFHKDSRGVWDFATNFYGGRPQPSLWEVVEYEFVRYGSSRKWGTEGHYRMAARGREVVDLLTADGGQDGALEHLVEDHEPIKPVPAAVRRAWEPRPVGYTREQADADRETRGER